MAFMTELATNASREGVHIIIYEGNDDSLVAHRGLQGQYTYLLTLHESVVDRLP